MKRTLSTVMFMLAAALALAGVAAPARAQPAEKPKVIRIGVAFVGIGNRPFMGGNSVGIAHARGAFEQEFKQDGIAIAWSFFQGAGPAVNEAIANGLIDFAWQGDLPAIIGKAGSLRTKLLLASGVRSDSYIAVPADSPIGSIEELRGKRVALSKGTNIQLAANRILEGHGLKERDLKIINMNQAATLAALATKDIDYKEDFRGDTVRVRNSPLFDAYLTGRYKAALEDAKKYGLVRRGFDVDAWIDRRYLNKALSEQHLESYWPQLDASGSPRLNLADASKEAGK
jgi:ABC-type nitrate/sulfonate/bicarbonate transport system substrate-binding protein